MRSVRPNANAVASHARLGGAPPTSAHRLDRVRAARGAMPLGPLVILAAALISSTYILAFPLRSQPGVRFWMFARLHHQMYEPRVAEWNLAAEPRVNLVLLGTQALEQRMLSAFLAETSVAELIEVERRNAARTFGGPLESVGFVDLTDRLRNEGLLDQINSASFSPWTKSGRIFGLPHDVHPVMLGYRADLVEAAGIDVSQIETWDDFVRILSPLMAETGSDGRPTRYLLNLWETHQESVELLLLQAGGGLFDEAGMPTLDLPVNTEVLTQIALWCVSDQRIAADAPYFSASGNRLLLDGFVIASFVPDWMCNIWRNEIPQLAGKVKLMPLPAWTHGGRRTSVWGGTMLGISRTAANPDALWKFAKHLYLSPELARELYRQGDIVSPVRSLWSDSIYDQPDEFFSEQPKGRMYIDLAPSVPFRHNSPFGQLAAERVQTTLVRLCQFVRSNPAADRALVHQEAQRLIRAAQADISTTVRRNVFARDRATSEAAP